MIPETGGKDIPDTRGAVVKNKIVFVKTVLREIIGLQELPDPFFFAAGQIEHLLGDAAAVVAVFLNERGEVLNRQEVQQLAPHEFPVEMRIAEIKSAVVENIIALRQGIVNPYGAVSEGGVKLASGAAGQQADLQPASFLLLPRSPRRYYPQGAEQEQQEQVPGA